ncbi:hypothetical protein [Rossellomorea marisflavi]|uniref:hypothetical protein n=1 Tax=Rossellomorea marisflavi TaxID=189381 RepID=UPI00345C8ADD
MEFFSDNELGKKELVTEEIGFNVYNAILGLFDKYEINFCKYFPENNDKREIIGTNRKALVNDIRGYIPSLENLSAVLEWDVPDKYAILDFVQYCFTKITDIEYDGRDFFGRDTYFTLGTDESKKSFQKEVNQLFERNQIVFYLDDDGSIKRQLPVEMGNLITNLPVKTNDDNLNELISLAIENIHKPKLHDRTFALEKLWDAFERMKTYYEGMNKKKSVSTLIDNVSKGTDDFKQIIESEFLLLTKIGNDYQIRHFEKGKIKVSEKRHVDYLFYRMINLISLCLNELNN